MESQRDLPTARKNFYRDHYRSAMNGLLFLGLILIALIAGVSYLATHRSVPAYYATSSDGALVTLTPAQ